MTWERVVQFLVAGIVLSVQVGVCIATAQMAKGGPAPGATCEETDGGESKRAKRLRNSHSA